jgi:hypothetical protein
MPPSGLEPDLGRKWPGRAGTREPLAMRQVAAQVRCFPAAENGPSSAAGCLQRKSESESAVFLQRPGRSQLEVAEQVLPTAGRKPARLAPDSSAERLTPKSRTAEPPSRVRLAKSRGFGSPGFRVRLNLEADATARERAGTNLEEIRIPA